MIRNGYLTHGDFESTFLSWEFGIPALDALALALLTTVLAYQVTAAFFNIVLGQKMAGKAKSSDLHTLLLSEESALLSVFAAVFRSDWLDRLRFHGDIPRKATIYRTSNRVRKKVLLRLCFLLITAPVLNLISIFMVLEHDETVSFAKAKFGGITFGISKNPPELKDLILLSSNCVRSSSRAHRGKVSARFSICSKPDVDQESSASLFSALQDPQLRLTILNISVGLTAGGEIAFEASAGSSSRGRQNRQPAPVKDRMITHADLSVNGELFRIRPALSEESAQIAIADGFSAATEFSKCRPVQQTGPTQSAANPPNGVKYTTTFKCNRIQPLDLSWIVLQTMANATLLDSDSFQITRLADTTSNSRSVQFFSGDDLPFLIRRRRNVGLVALLIIVVISIVFRLTTSLLFQNDIGDGIEAVVKARLGIQTHQSMLMTDRVISYNHKKKMDKWGHYGMDIPSWDEVETFTDGTVIGFENRGNID